MRSQTSILYAAVHCRRSRPPVTPGVADVKAGIEANRSAIRLLHPVERGRLEAPEGVDQPLLAMAPPLAAVIGSSPRSGKSPSEASGRSSVLVPPRPDRQRREQEATGPLDRADDEIALMQGAEAVPIEDHHVLRVQ